MASSKIKILAIDDNPDNLTSLRALIKELFPDALAFTALNGPTGLALAAAEDPDVILLDVVMPDMDGFDVCCALKGDRNLADIPVVFVTAIKGEKESRIRALEAGGEAFLAKPIDESELTAQIRAMAKIKASNIERRKEKEGLAALVEEQTRKLVQTHRATLNLLEDLRRENNARRKGEEELRRSLEEKEVLLREVHHRVKNNLNVISSLLNLQSSAIQTPEQAVAAFQNSRDRIMAMAMVHKELYESRNYASVDMSEYLENLTRHVLEAYGSGGNVSLISRAEGISLSVSTCIPCGLILNELITNAFKHAFPGGAAGEIRIALGAVGDESFELSVSDNGIGLPEGCGGGNAWSHACPSACRTA